MVKSFAIKDTIMAPNFSLYRTIKGGRKKASFRCVSNTEIVKFFGRAKGKLFVQLHRQEKRQTLHHTRNTMIEFCHNG